MSCAFISLAQDEALRETALRRGEHVMMRLLDACAECFSRLFGVGCMALFGCMCIRKYGLFPISGNLMITWGDIVLFWDVGEVLRQISSRGDLIVRLVVVGSYSLHVSRTNDFV